MLKDTIREIALTALLQIKLNSEPKILFYIQFPTKKQSEFKQKREEE